MSWCLYTLKYVTWVISVPTQGYLPKLCKQELDKRLTKGYSTKLCRQAWQELGCCVSSIEGLVDAL